MLTERDYANEFKRRMILKMAQVGVLRATLAPLLDDPIRHEYVSDDDSIAVCLFCDTYDSLKTRHASSCPVLHKDSLLGRSS